MPLIFFFFNDLNKHKLGILSAAPDNRHTILVSKNDIVDSSLEHSNNNFNKLQYNRCTQWIKQIFKIQVWN